MHAQDVLKYGNLTVLHTVDSLSEADWDQPDVCGYWSTRQIVAHLASFEHILVEMFQSALGGETGPYYAAWMADGQLFNDTQVPARDGLSAAETLAEYEATQALTMELAAELAPNRYRIAGIFPEYGLEYDLEDIIAYGFYGHKREHCSQINVFKDSLEK